MNNRQQFFKYITGNSKIHLMNSKMKILWFILMSLLIFIINDYISLAIVSSFLLFIMVMWKI